MLEKINVRVKQKPEIVRFKCPRCGVVHDYPYGDFVTRFGGCRQWSGKIITCPACMSSYEIFEHWWGGCDEEYYDEFNGDMELVNVWIPKRIEREV